MSARLGLRDSVHVLCGTFRMPSTNADVKFGLGEEGDEELTSCLRLYWAPFRAAARSLRKRWTVDRSRET